MSAAIIVFIVMKKQDEQIDDREFGDEHDIAKFGPLENGKEEAK